MELTHEFTVPADLEQTWAAFDDIEAVAVCFPGAKVTSVEGDTFQGSVKVKLGPIALVYNGSGTFVEKDESAHRMKIEAKGKDKRGNGTAGADVVALLSNEGGATKVTVHTDLSITGKPAQFGRGVMQDVSDKLLGQFVSCLEQRLGEPAGTLTEEPAEPAEPPVSAPTPSQPVTEASEVAETNRVQPESAGQFSPMTSPPDDAIDLGSTVLPVLLKTYWKQGVIGLIVVVALVRWLRR